MALKQALEQGITKLTRKDWAEDEYLEITDGIATLHVHGFDGQFRIEELGKEGWLPYAEKVMV